MNYKIYYRIALCVLSLLCSYTSWSQIPHLTGTINISLEDKSFSCNLSYDQIPEGYHILLNQAIKSPIFKINNSKLHFRTVKNSIHYVDALQYEILAERNENIQINYQYKESQEASIQNTLVDWKGNLAFTDDYFRATEQSAWYPILYNPINGRQITDINYEIKLICNDCESIYLNGSHPDDMGIKTFTSKKASALLIYAGNFHFENFDGINLINSPLSDKENRAILNFMKEVENFYESKTHISFDRDLALLSSTPTSQNDAWLFVTYPTIAIIGADDMGIKGWVKDGVLDSMRISALAHEMGHYYLGNIYLPSGPLFWTFLEGFTEYISIQANREIFGEDLYRKLLLKYKSQVQGLAFKPLSQITDQDEIDGTYRYAYIPLLLTAIENEIGIDAMWQWIRQILSYKHRERADYSFFKKTFIESGQTERLFTDLEAKFISGPNTGIHIDQVIFSSISK